MERLDRAFDRPSGSEAADGTDRGGTPPRRGARPVAAAAAILAAVLLACGPGGDDGGAERTGGDGRPQAAPATASGDEQAEAGGGREGPAYGIRLSTDRAVYAPGDTIRMRLEVFRRGGEPLTLSFPTAQRHDFVLRGPGTSGPDGEVWRWSEGRFFAQSTATVTLDDEGPSITADAAHPAPGTPGLYRLEGRIVASEWPISAVVPVTVAP